MQTIYFKMAAMGSIFVKVKTGTRDDRFFYWSYRSSDETNNDIQNYCPSSRVVKKESMAFSLMMVTDCGFASCGLRGGHLGQWYVTGLSRGRSEVRDATRAVPIGS